MTVILNFILLRSRHKIERENVLHVPTMGVNLMSVGMMKDRAAAMRFENGRAIINMCGKHVACGKRNTGLYNLDMAPRTNISAVASLQLWNERTGNVTVASVERMIEHNDVDRLKCSSIDVWDICSVCVCDKNKMTPTPIASGLKVIQRLQPAHSDLGGPMPEPSRGGALCLGTIKHDFPPWTDVVFSHIKGTPLAEFKKRLVVDPALRAYGVEPRQKAQHKIWSATQEKEHERRDHRAQSAPERRK